MQSNAMAVDQQRQATGQVRGERGTSAPIGDTYCVLLYLMSICIARGWHRFDGGSTDVGRVVSYHGVLLAVATE